LEFADPTPDTGSTVTRPGAETRAERIERILGGELRNHVRRASGVSFDDRAYAEATALAFKDREREAAETGQNPRATYREYATDSDVSDRQQTTCTLDRRPADSRERVSGSGLPRD
jgi:hypothetical protein